MERESRCLLKPPWDKFSFDVLTGEETVSSFTWLVAGFCCWQTVKRKSSTSGWLLVLTPVSWLSPWAAHSMAARIGNALARRMSQLCVMCDHAHITTNIVTCYEAEAGTGPTHSRGGNYTKTWIPEGGTHRTTWESDCHGQIIFPLYSFAFAECCCTLKVHGLKCKKPAGKICILSIKELPERNP